MGPNFPGKDDVSAFVDSVCEITHRKTDWILRKKLYDIYCEYCKEFKCERASICNVGRHLIELGVKKAKAGGLCSDGQKWKYIGIKLKVQSPVEYRDSPSDHGSPLQSEDGMELEALLNAPSPSHTASPLPNPQPLPDSPQPLPASPQPHPASPQPHPASPQPHPASPLLNSGTFHPSEYQFLDDLLNDLNKPNPDSQQPSDFDFLDALLNTPPHPYSAPPQPHPDSPQPHPDSQQPSDFTHFLHNFAATPSLSPPDSPLSSPDSSLSAPASLLPLPASP